MDGEIWKTQYGMEVKNPLIQLSRCESLLRQLLQKAGINLKVKAHLVFIRGVTLKVQGLSSKKSFLNTIILAHPREAPTIPNGEISDYMIIEKSIPLPYPAILLNHFSTFHQTTPHSPILSYKQKNHRIHLQSKILFHKLF